MNNKAKLLDMVRNKTPSKNWLLKRLLCSGEDRTAETVETFFDYLRQDRWNRSRPFVVICGHPPLYIDAIKKLLPNAILFLISWIQLITSEKRGSKAQIRGFETP